MTSSHVVIVGGGISGLNTAFRLQKLANEQGKEITITLLEESGRFGGKIQTYREQGFVMESGPDSILAWKPAGLQLIRELGIESEVVGTNPSLTTTILHHGRLKLLPPGSNLGIPANVLPFAKTPLLSIAAKIRALFDLFLPASSVQGDESLGRFLRHRLGNELVNHIVEPLLAGIYAGSVDDLSLLATFPQFRTLTTKYRSLIIGSMLQKKNAPARPNGRSAFITLKSGLETITERLHDMLIETVTFRNHSSVTGIAKNEHGYDVHVTHDGHTEILKADAVVVATPAYVTAKLLQNIVPETAVLQEILYVSTATVLLAYPTNELQAPSQASGFVVPRTENRPITAVTWVSNKWPHSTPTDYTLIRAYVGRTGQTDGLDMSNEQMVEMVRHELRDIIGTSAKPWFTKVTRWTDAMPQYRVNHLQKVDIVETAIRQQAPGLMITGAGYRGVGIPDCVAQSNATADRIMDYLTATNI